MTIPALLQQFVDDELIRSAELIAQLQSDTLETLRRDKPGGGFAPNEIQQLPHIAQVLQLYARRFTEHFLDVLQELVQADMLGVVVSSVGTAVKVTGVERLTLIDETLVEAEIAVSRATQLVCRSVEWELSELQGFTSALRGDRQASTESNPLRPALFVRALWEAVCAMPLPPAERVLLLRACAASIGKRLKACYAGACSRLAAQGVEPSQYRTGVMPTGVVLAAGRLKAQPAVDLRRKGVLKEIVKRMPLGRHREHEAGAPALHGAKTRSADFEKILLQLDQSLQMDQPLSGPRVGSLLTTQRTHLAAHVSSVSDRQTIEFLSRLFDAIIADPQLQAPVKAVIVRLQVSALRVALHDTTVFAASAHPMWLMIDRIADGSEQLVVVGPSRMPALLKFCEALVNDLALRPAPNAALFRQGLQEFESFLASGLSAAAQSAQRITTALDHVQRCTTLQMLIQDRLGEQLATADISSKVYRFLFGPWARLIAEATLRLGHEHETTQRYTKTVDDLLWSLNPPTNPMIRDRMLKLLPGVLKNLREGMARVDIPHAEQQVLLDELLASHTDLLHRGEAPAGPEETLRRLRDDTLEHPPDQGTFMNSLRDLSTLDSAPAELAALEDEMPELQDSALDPAGEHTRWVDAICPGACVCLLLQGRHGRVQLLWRSDSGVLLLFAARAGATHALTRRALARLHAEGLATPDQPSSLIQRAVDAVIANL